MEEEYHELLRSLQNSRLGKFISVDIATGCWMWKGSRSKGYGIVSWQGKGVLVHRLVYQLAKGAIPEGKIIMHQCETPPCCNPAHLHPGTYQQNSCHMWGYPFGTVGSRSSVSNKTAPTGRPTSYRDPTKPSRSDLAAEKRELMRVLHEQGVFQKDIAKRLSVDPAYVSRVINGKQ